MRWYQVVPVEGVTFEDEKRARSRFWNEGKWRTFVEPLLPQQRRTFLEIGCNAGLMLKLAMEAGFTNVVGVEARGRVMDQAKEYQKLNGLPYRLVWGTAGVDLDLDALPVADVVLLSNMHYYLPVADLSRLVDKLQQRCRYCIVVGAKARARQGNAKHYLRAIRGYFHAWDELGTVENVDPEGDPSPRPDMYGVVFRGHLQAVEVAPYYGAWYEAAKSWRHRSHGLAPALQDFFERVVAGDMEDVKETNLYAYWQARQPKADNVRRLEEKAALARDIRDHGMREPIYMDWRHKMLDGIHRMCIARVLGYDWALVRVL